MKILVINTKFLGDLIVSTQGLNALRKKNPNSEIVLITRKGYEETLRNNPNIDRIIPFDFSVKKKNIFSRISSEIKFIYQIRKERFDVIIALHPGDRIAFLAWLSGAKIRIAPRKQPFNFLFNVLVDVEEDSISYLDYYNKLIIAFTKESIKGNTEFFVSEPDSVWADEFLKENNVNRDDLIIGIHPGASEPTKIWPSENFADLIQKLFSTYNSKIFLIAGPNEEKIVDTISAKLNNENLVVYKSTDVNRSAALIKKCRIFISNDTGTRHLSVALRTPVIALMPDDNQKCWNFYEGSDNHFVLTGKRTYPINGVPFLGSITVDEVFNKVNEVLNK
ncbi:MAG: glycosyltransferase family 9 protein [Ignavibacteriales bacterium]|nr:glycosyltransferase family 9 protein [Ignavibacteriales bacterium]